MTTAADCPAPPTKCVYSCCWCLRSLTADETWEIGFEGGGVQRMCADHKDKDVDLLRQCTPCMTYGPVKVGRPA